MLLILFLFVYANKVERIEVTSNTQVFAGIVRLGYEDTLVSSYYNTSALVSYLFFNQVVNSTQFVYVDRMDHLALIQAVAVDTPQPQLAPVSFPEFTLLLDVYHTDMVFLGRPPREYTRHLEPALCTDKEVLVDGFSLSCLIHDQPCVLSAAVVRHVINNASVCGWVDILIDKIILHEWVDCTNYVNGSKTILSATQLGLGYGIYPNDTCVYKKKENKYDYISSVIAPVVLLYILSVWTSWTQHLWEHIVFSLQKEVWALLFSGYTKVCDAIVILVNLAVFATVYDIHGFYTIPTERMVDHSLLRFTVDVYAMVCCGVGLWALFSITVGYVLHYNSEMTQYQLLSWGLEFLNGQPLWYRGFASLLVIISVYATLITVWFYGIKDKNGTYAILITSVLVVAHKSSPSVMTRLILRHRDVLDPYMNVFLLSLRWCVQFLIITSIQYSIPFDINGILSIQFTALCSIIAGVILLFTTGRDFAHILVLISRMRQPKTYLIVLIVAYFLMLFVVWFAAVFSIGGSMFANGEALYNKGSLALRCGFGVSFGICSYHFKHNVDKSYTGAAAYTERTNELPVHKSKDV